MPQNVRTNDSTGLGTGSPPTLSLPSELRSRASRAARLQCTVLIMGPTGTGKSVLARWLHEHSPRQGEAFVTVDCGVVASELLPSALFGHKKGAFTGAADRREGLVVSAQGGTVFFDEIATLSVRDQARLLRILEEGVAQPIGADKAVELNVRVICATNQNLLRLIEEGKFRRDLFHRINRIALSVPPLSKRKDEFPAILARVCWAIRTKELGSAAVPPLKITEEGVEFLRSQAWEHGNIRELHNAVLTAYLCAWGEPIRRRHLLYSSTSNKAPVKRDSGALSRSDVSSGAYQAPDDSSIEQEMIIEALGRSGGNKRRAARALGMSRSTLYERLHRYGIEVPVADPDASA